MAMFLSSKMEFEQSFEDGATVRVWLERVVGYEMSSQDWKAFSQWIEDPKQREKNLIREFFQINIKKVDGELSCHTVFNKKKMKEADIKRVERYIALLNRMRSLPPPTKITLPL